MPFTSPGAPVDPLATFVWLKTETVVARPGGGKAQATPLRAQVSHIATVGSSADSVVIDRVAYKDDWQMIHNGGQNPVQVLAKGDDTINGQPAGVGISLVAGAWAVLHCFANGAWLGPTQIG
jgi:hypothetical protein